MGWRRVFAAGVAVLLAAAWGSVRGQEEGGPVDAAEDEGRRWIPPWVSGYFETNLELSRTDRDGNVLLDQILRLQVEPPGQDRARLLGGIWAIQDLDGHEDRTSSLSTIHNTFGASVQVRLLHLYLEVDDVWGDSTLRLGRQRILDNPAYNRIDGLYFKQREAGWEWYVFGGARASLYETAYDDLTLGGGAAFQVSPRTRIAVDGFYGEETRRRGEEVLRGPVVEFLRLPFPRRVRRQLDSRMYSLSVNHRLSANHQLFARYTVFDGESEEIVVTATGFVTKNEIIYDLTYRRLENTLGDRANDVTGFFRVLGEQNRFDEVIASVHFPLSERVTLSLEGQIRETESDDPNTANRDFQRFAAVFSREDLWKGFDASVALEHWNVSGGEGSFIVTGDVSKSWDRWRVRVGADFERWEDRIIEFRPGVLPATRAVGRFSPFVRRFSSVIASFFDIRIVETHENVRSLYTTVDYTIDRDSSLTLRASYQEDDGPDSPYWRFRLTYRIRF